MSIRRPKGIFTGIRTATRHITAGIRHKQHRANVLQSHRKAESVSRVLQTGGAIVHAYRIGRIRRRAGRYRRFRKGRQRGRSSFRMRVLRVLNPYLTRLYTWGQEFNGYSGSVGYFMSSATTGETVCGGAIGIGNNVAGLIFGGYALWKDIADNVTGGPISGETGHYYVNGGMASLQLMNLASTAVTITAYELYLKKSLHSDASYDQAQEVFNELVARSGAVINGNSIPDVFSLRDMPEFKDYFVIRSKKKAALGAGASTRFTYKIGRRHIKLGAYLGPDGTTVYFRAVPGDGLLLFKVSTVPISNSTAAGGQASANTTKAPASIRISGSSKYFLSHAGQTTYVATHKDTTGGFAYNASAVHGGMMGLKPNQGSSTFNAGTGTDAGEVSGAPANYML